MSEELRREVRQILQEEIRSINVQRPVQTMISRTRSLLSQAAQSVSHATGGQSSNLYRSSPSHPNRLNISGKGKKRKANERDWKTFGLQVIKNTIGDELNISNTLVLLKEVMLNLGSDMEEDVIRETILKALKVKYPLLKKHEFEFMKRGRSSLSKPVVDDDFKWNFPQIKTLIGQGKLYIRLTVDEDILVDTDDDSDDDHNLPSCISNLQTDLASNSTNSTRQANRVPAAVYKNKPCCSTQASDSGLSKANILSLLSEVFPDTPLEVREDIANRSSNSDEAVDLLLTSYGNNNISVEKRLMQQLDGKPRIRVYVDQEYMVEDCFSFYKSDNFNPQNPIRLVFADSPAIDAGGLFRQFYATVFLELTNPHRSTVRLFEGTLPYMLPIATAETCLSEIFVVVGKIVAHNICQGGEGFPVLAPSVYQYLVTGNIQQSMMNVNPEKVCSHVYKHFIKEITDADKDKLHELQHDDCLGQIIDEIGETGVILSENTKSKIVQSMVVHDVLVKRKASLDQFRQGLSILKVLESIKSHPIEMQKFFVDSGDMINPDQVLNKLEYVNGTEVEKSSINAFIAAMSPEQMKIFCMYATGAPSIWSLKSRMLKVQFHDLGTFANSTCFFHVKIPRYAVQEGILQECFDAVYHDPKNTFNMM